MHLMNFYQCFTQLNWLSIIVITTLAAIVDILIGVKKDKKIMNEFQNELKSLHEIKDIVITIKSQIDKLKL